MEKPERSQLSEPKYQEIEHLLQELAVDLTEIEEHFVLGHGRGGQKRNKTHSVVQLKHLPTGLIARCQDYRERSMNRLLALRSLLTKLAAARGLILTKGQQAAVKKQKQKARRQRRARQRFENPSSSPTIVP